MAETINVFGVCHVKVGTGAAGALERLGLTQNGAHVRFEVLTGDVPGDENGGDQGPPIDVQYFGERAHIRIELTKYDPAVADKLRKLSATVGKPGVPGTLLFGDGRAIAVRLDNLATFMEFGRCIVREPIEVNKGTKFATLVLSFEAHKDGTGALWTTGSSGSSSA